MIKTCKTVLCFVYGVMAIICAAAARIRGYHMTEGEILVAFWPLFLLMIACCLALVVTANQIKGGK